MIVMTQSPDQIPRQAERHNSTRSGVSARDTSRASDTIAALTRALAEHDEKLRIAADHIETLEREATKYRRDLNDALAREAQASLDANRDELTGLANRRLLKDRFVQAVAQGARQQRTVALILLDLDSFKTINDRLGHEVGDVVLREIAVRLVAGTRTTDTVCRYGGDEFVILIPEVDTGHTVDIVTLKLQSAISVPVITDRYSIRLSASAGFVNYPRDGETCEAIMRIADDALYRAKSSRGEVSIFTRRDPPRLDSGRSSAAV